MSERIEALMRIVVGLVTGIILGLWKALIQAVGLINFLITLITGKRNKQLADFSEIWNTQMYPLLRYMSFFSNPFLSPVQLCLGSFHLLDQLRITLKWPKNKHPLGD